MKPNPAPRPLSIPPRQPRPQERGVALVTVLAIMLLMTVLIMSFFTMAKNELNASLKDSDNMKARSYADAAVNMVIAQIRGATTAIGSDGTTILPWSSQPGAIRVFQTHGALQRIAKLYSSAQMSANTTQQVRSQDVQQNWDSEPDQWVDMNEPVVIPDPNRPESLAQAELIFPIVDPRAAMTLGSNSKPVEGFDYQTNAVNGAVKTAGGNGYNQRLPMPVRWIYLLADGSVGTLNSAGEFNAAPQSSQPSEENPIVGRVAFWTDDETCKINVNTASEGVFWDTPRTSSDEDQLLGKFQPVGGEYQRYPGHPAMVCLSSVLFPGKRLRADGSKRAETGQFMDDLTLEEAREIWKMSPYIWGQKDEKTSNGGTTQSAVLKQTATPQAGKLNALKGWPFYKHLYNTYDDYAIASTADAYDAAIPAEPTTPPPADAKERETIQESSDFPNMKQAKSLERIKQGRFFLTTRSSAPEITLNGTPRVSLWPIDTSVMTKLVLKDPSTGSISGQKFTAYDMLIGFNSSTRRPINANATRYDVIPYFYQRDFNRAGHRHGEFDIGTPHINRRLWLYLVNSISRPTPGFTLQGGSSGAVDTKKFQDLGEKYGLSQYEDLRAIIGSAVDYIRNQNLYDGNLSSANYYASGGRSSDQSFGQVTSICFCEGAGYHNATWSNANTLYSKGMGRVPTVSEVSLLFTLRSKRLRGGAVIGGPMLSPHKTFADDMGPSMDHYEIEVGLLVEGFVPAHGWGEMHPQMTFMLAGFDGATKLGTRRNAPPGSGGAQRQLPDWLVSTAGTGNNETRSALTLNGQDLTFQTASAPGSNAVTSTSTTGLANDWIGWGGSLGVRWMENMIVFKPILISVPTGTSPPGSLNFSGTGAAGADHHLRLISFDNRHTGANVSASLPIGDIFQIYPLAFPGFNEPTQIFQEPTPMGLRRMTAAGAYTPGPTDGSPDRYHLARKDADDLFSPTGLIRPRDHVKSLVPVHGDFRLLAGRRIALLVRDNASGASADVTDYPVFVPHPNYFSQRQAHSITEPKPQVNLMAREARGADGRIGFTFKNDDFGYFTNEAGIRDLRLKTEYQPDFPIKPWANTRMQVWSGVRPTDGGALSGGRLASISMDELFNVGRFDMRGGRYTRNAARPDYTGDFDNGVGPAPDGPYVNRGDDGEAVGAAEASGFPYFSKLEPKSRDWRGTRPLNQAMFSPNRLIPSSGALGSIPTGIQANVPWQTLLFRPDIELHRRNQSEPRPERRHFGSRFPRDHLFLDAFWMPVVQPYAMSEPFETKGKINMNHQILPFTYITRTTALRALLKAEKITAIPNEDTDVYKIGTSNNENNGTYRSAENSGRDVHFRHFIDANQTLRQWDQRFAGTDEETVSRGGGNAPGAFLSPSQICDLWLVPEGTELEDMAEFWDDHRQTGDNSKERPYTNLYPRLTTRSNTYRVYVIAQSLRKNLRSDPGVFNQANGDQVSAEYKGSYLVERSINPTDRQIPNYVNLFANSVGGTVAYNSLDNFYYYRITQVKQFSR